LRGGSKPKEEHNEESDSHAEETEVKTNSFSLPLWLTAGGGAALATVAFMGGAFWSNRRNRSRLVPAGNLDYDGFKYETEVYLDNHKQPTLSTSDKNVEERDHPRHSDGI
jgi:cobalt-zinc-cadmium efflux system membrane fusion protein